MDSKVHTRYNYLDWLRVLGILFVFIYHTNRLYNVEDWAVKNNIWYPSAQVWNDFVTSFMMPLMFVISGASLFYALGKGRGGFGKFLKDKVLRLLVPLLVADLTHISIQDYLFAISHGMFHGSFFEFLPQYYHLGSLDWWRGAHLWYLMYLFLFSLILYPLLRWFKGGGQGFLSRLGGALAKTGVLYVLAFPLLLLYALVDSSSPIMSANGGWPYMMYLWFLLLGFLLVSDQRIQERVRQLRWVSLAVGLAMVAGYVTLYTLTPDKNTFSLAQALWGIMHVFGGWICILGIVGLGMQYLTARTPRLAYANEAVLPFYILHQTIIVVVGYFVLQWGLPDPLEWAVVAVISFGAILGCYEFLVRRWNGMRFLFGMKRLPPRPAEGVIQPQTGGAVRAE